VDPAVAGKRWRMILASSNWRRAKRRHEKKKVEPQIDKHAFPFFRPNLDRAPALCPSHTSSRPGATWIRRDLGLPQVQVSRSANCSDDGFPSMDHVLGREHNTTDQRAMRRDPPDRGWSSNFTSLTSHRGRSSQVVPQVKHFDVSAVCTYSYL
jgi:hypothetical protein